MGCFHDFSYPPAKRGRIIYSFPKASFYNSLITVTHKSKKTRLIAGFRGLVGIRTPNLLIRSQMLYPIELRDL